jgi:hypothetical protein
LGFIGQLLLSFSRGNLGSRLADELVALNRTVVLKMLDCEAV